MFVLCLSYVCDVPLGHMIVWIYLFIGKLLHETLRTHFEVHSLWIWQMTRKIPNPGAGTLPHTKHHPSVLLLPIFNASYELRSYEVRS